MDAIYQKHFGLVKAPAYVGWVRFPHQGWLAVASDDDLAVVTRLVDVRSKGCFWVVMKMGEQPDDHMLPKKNDEWPKKRPRPTAVETAAANAVDPAEFNEVIGKTRNGFTIQRPKAKESRDL